MKATFKLSQLSHIANGLLSVNKRSFCFYGQMGSGKTTLIKALIKELGGIDMVSSPTFGLVNEYHDANGQPLAYHFDLYRIKSEVEAMDLGLEEYYESDAYVFIEWPEKIPNLLPEERHDIYLYFVDENTRRIKY